MDSFGTVAWILRPTAQPAMARTPNRDDGNEQNLTDDFSSHRRLRDEPPTAAVAGLMEYEEAENGTGKLVRSSGTATVTTPTTAEFRLEKEAPSPEKDNAAEGSGGGGHGTLLFIESDDGEEEEEDEEDIDHTAVATDPPSATTATVVDASSSVTGAEQRSSEHSDMTDGAGGGGGSEGAKLLGVGEGEEPVRMPLLNYLCAFNDCSMKELQLLFHSVHARQRMVAHLQQHCRLHTAHLKPAERNIALHCHDLSVQNANRTFACGGYLELTVRQYFFAKHGLKLKHPYMPCMIEFGGGTHASYYPLELVNVVLKRAKQETVKQEEPYRRESGDVAPTKSMAMPERHCCRCCCRCANN
ncbi:hypothetical protein niasHT_019667 [Heterodera trifolii]|uniref:Uncharacterized protein n=1 Tax=Heterodera trifolii TaxID=157864 RepID=A0ABD2LJP3_9BILA